MALIGARPTPKESIGDRMLGDVDVGQFGETRDSLCAREVLSVRRNKEKWEKGRAHLLAQRAHELRRSEIDRLQRCGDAFSHAPFRPHLLHVLGPELPPFRVIFHPLSRFVLLPVFAFVVRGRRLKPVDLLPRERNAGSSLPRVPCGIERNAEIKHPIERVLLDGVLAPGVKRPRRVHKVFLEVGIRVVVHRELEQHSVERIRRHDGARDGGGSNQRRTEETR